MGVRNAIKDTTHDAQQMFLDFVLLFKRERHEERVLTVDGFLVPSSWAATPAEHEQEVTLETQPEPTKQDKADPFADAIEQAGLGDQKFFSDYLATARRVKEK